MSRPRKIEVNTRVFESIDTPEKAYWLGFIRGDGCVWRCSSSRRSPFYVIMLTLAEVDREHLEKFKSFIGTNACISKVRGKYYQLVIYSKEMFHDLRRSLVIPPPVSEDLLPHFLRGLLDSDGTIFFKREKRYENPSWKDRIRPAVGFSGSQELIDWVADVIWRKLWLTGKVERCRNQRGLANAWKITYKGVKNCGRLLAWLYEDSEGIRLERKFQRAWEILCWAEK